MDWNPFENETTIGTRGSEGGVIIFDIEHPAGARITVEEDCDLAPYGITFGIYGLMFHTHYESQFVKTHEYVIQSQQRIEKILTWMAIQDEEKTDTWRTHYNHLLNELAEI